MTEAIDELGKLAIALSKEKEYDERQHHVELKDKPVKERKESGTCWSPVRVVKISYTLGGRATIQVERNPSDKQDHSFQGGTPVFLFGKEEKGERAVVSSVDDQNMTINLYRSEVPDWIEDELVGVELSFDSRSYKEMELALNKLINAENNVISDLRECLIGGKEPHFSSEETEKIELLNDSQNEAVELILRSENIAIIHGPPGTGKTTTLVEACKQVLQNESQVLACAPSNTATDLLAQRLHTKGLKAIRVGELSRIDEELETISLDWLVQNDPAYEDVKTFKRKALKARKKASKYKRSFGSQERQMRSELYAEARELNKEAFKLEDYISERILSEAQVIVTTIISSSTKILRDRKYSTVFIDEAGQATEPATWVALLRAERAVLAGDPFQLPPTVKSQEADKMGLSVSLLEKVMQRKKVDHMLELQYRMHEMIMGFSSQEFYSNKLKAHSSVAQVVLEDGFAPLEFIDTAGCDFREKQSESSKSLSNPGEAEILLKRLHDLQETFSTQDLEIGIISPYREQVKRLRRLLGDGSPVSVNTVDGFQGQEKEVILISLVRSNQDGKIGFLSDFRRMNVALTRARKKLIILGDSSTIGSEAFYSRFLEYAETRGTYRSAWEWM